MSSWGLRPLFYVGSEAYQTREHFLRDKWHHCCSCCILSQVMLDARADREAAYTSSSRPQILLAQGHIHRWCSCCGWNTWETSACHTSCFTCHFLQGIVRSPARNSWLLYTHARTRTQAGHTHTTRICVCTNKYERIQSGLFDEHTHTHANKSISCDSKHTSYISSF